MAVLTLTSAMALQVAQWSMGQQRYDVAEQSAASGHTAVRVGAPPRWRLRLATVPALVAADAAPWKALALGLRGRINHLALWDITNPVPRGTARGSITLASTAAAGATSLQLAGATATGAPTLLAGDMLQLGTGVGSHYVMVLADATGTLGGDITVSVEPPLRASVASGTAVAWNQPLCHFKVVPDSLGWDGVPGSADVGGFSFELLEDWNA